MYGYVYLLSVYELYADSTKTHSGLNHTAENLHLRKYVMFGEACQSGGQVQGILIRIHWQINNMIMTIRRNDQNT